jgi:hypothetical protein
VVGDRELPGRQRRTASMEARQGWICKGMLKVTKATMAALAMVEAMDAGSVRGLSVRGSLGDCWKLSGTYTCQRCSP